MKIEGWDSNKEYVRLSLLRGGRLSVLKRLPEEEDFYDSVIARWKRRIRDVLWDEDSLNAKYLRHLLLYGS